MKELLLLSLLGVVALFSEILNIKKILFPLLIAGLAATVGLCIMDWNTNENLFGMQHVSNYALAFTGLFAVITLFWMLLTKGHFDKISFVDHYALIFFSLAGAFVLVSFTNFTMLFLGIEILSLPMFVLAGSHKNNILSSEAAYKYFLMGVFATGFLLFGIAMIYGSTGTFDLLKLREILSTSAKGFGLVEIGMVLILVGMIFKVGAVPFHFWTPDVYQGSPTLITAFMSTVVKTAGVAAFYRLCNLSFSAIIGELQLIFIVVIVLTLIVGNFLAAYQTNSKRLLAYSSVAHSGFMLMGLLCLEDTNSASMVFYYSAVYSLAGIIAFFTLYKVSEATYSEEVGAYFGLNKINPILAVCMTISLLSMAGIPPFAGFFGKYFFLVSLLKNGYLWIAIVAIFTSLIGVYYYFKVLMGMYSKAPEKDVTIPVSFIQNAVLIIATILILVLGIVPGIVSGLI